MPIMPPPEQATQDPYEKDVIMEDSAESLPQKLKDALLTVVKHYRQEDREDRELQLPKWRRNELYWRGVQDIYFSDVIQDFRSISEESGGDLDEEEYNSIINIFKAYGEIIIAALLAGYPKTHYFPQNADNIEDIIAAREFNKLGGLIQKWNNTEFLLYHALYILYTQDFVAAYTYYREDKEFGTRRIPKTAQFHTVEDKSVCLECQKEVEDEICPECGAETVIASMPTIAEEETGEFEEKPKGRQVIEAYGPLNVAVPTWVKNIRQTPWLRLETEEHYSMLREIYPGIEIGTGPDANTDADYRAPIPGGASTRRGIKTVERWWFRPWAFNILDEQEERDGLKALFADGAYVVVIDNDKIAETMEENLTKCWAISRAPLSSHIHSPAMGDSIVPVQDMRNDLVSISLQTAKRGIGETFADMGVIDWDTYADHRNEVGVVFPAKARKDRSLSDSFYQQKNASLSQEIGKFFGQLDADAALMTRAYPPIYGGGVEGSHTLGEYDIRRAQSLQSLSIPWKILNWWFAETMENSTRGYKEYMVEDQSYTSRQGGRFSTTTVSLENLQMGELGEVLPEVSEKFPTSWAERKAVMMELISLNNEAINATLFNPNNIPITTQIIGIEGIKVPGAADREKQLWEISQLLQQEPIGDPFTGEMQPSIPIEPEICDSAVCIEVIRDWALSEEGQEAKISNPGGYLNVLAQLAAHNMNQQMIMQQQMEAEMAMEQERVAAQPAANEGGGGKQRGSR